MNFRFLQVALLLACPSLIHAACTLHNKMDKPETKQDKRDALCLPTGEGTWTFAMRTSEVVFPTFDRDNMWAGHASTHDFILYDNNCVPQGVYSPEGNNCGTPYVIDDMKKFRISYANGDYMIRENHAICHDMNKGLRVEVGCRAAFPIHGEPK